MFLSKLKVARVVLLATVVLVSGSGLLMSRAGGDEKPDPKPRAGARDAPPPALVGKITGRVVNAADGRPVAGADVRLRHRAWTKPGTHRSTTNAHGEFTFDAVVPGEYVVWSFHGNLASRSKRYQGDAVDVAADGTSKPIVLKMQPGVSIHVKVLSQTDGQPIAGARVRLLWTDGDRDHFTDAKGEVELLALTAETWNVQATAKDYTAQERTVTLTNQHPAALEMRLPPGGSVEGRAQDENGRPLPGITVTVFGSSREAYALASAKTDAEGRYRIDYLPLGENLQFLLGNQEYPSQTKQLRLDPSGARLGRVDAVLKKRPPGASVRGVVTDQQGRPIPGAEVTSQFLLPDMRRTQTDAQGRFRLDNVYPGLIGHEIVVRAKGFAVQRVTFSPRPVSGLAEVTIKLKPGHRIQGVVVDEAGKPIPGVMINGDNGRSIGFGVSMYTDASGKFQFDSLPDKALFEFRAQGYSEIRDRKLPLDGDKEVVVTMKSQGIIKGRVVDAATGKPMSRFLVRFTRSADYRPGEPEGSIESRRSQQGEEFVSADGQFLLKDLTAGMPLQVSITADGYRRQVVRRAVAQVASEAQALEIRLRAEDPTKLLTVTGRLVNSKGEGVRGADLRLIVATDRPVRGRDGWPYNWPGIQSGWVEQAPNVLDVQRKTTGADGSFAFQRVPNDAEIELVHWGKGIAAGRMDHLERLSDKERTGLIVKVVASARITGTIDRTVFPEFIDIVLSGSGPVSSLRPLQATVAVDGKSFVIEDVPAGRYLIRVYGPALRSDDRPDGPLQTQIVGSKPVTVEEGKEEKVSLGTGDRLEPPLVPQLPRPGAVGRPRP